MLPGRFIENEVRINLLGLMNTHIFAAKQMVKQGFGGRIIGAGSIASYRTAENLGPYGGTKFAVRGMTQCAAMDYGKYGITVNAYAPGATETPLSELRILTFYLVGPSRLVYQWTGWTTSKRQ